MKSYTYCFLIVTFLFSFQSGGQGNIEADPFQLIEESKKIFRSDPSKGLDYAIKAEEIARQNSDKKAIGEALKLQGNINYMLGNYTHAMETFLSAYDHFQQIQDTLNMAGMMASTGLVHKATGAYEQALKAYDQAQELANSIENVAIEAKIINNKGVIYRKTGAYDMAEKSFLRSLEIKKGAGDNKGVANSLTNLGNISADQNAFDRAIDFFQQAYEMEEQLNSKEGMAMNLNNMANVFLKKRDYPNAIVFANRGLKIGNELGTKVQIKEASNILSSAYSALGNYRLAFEHFKNYHEASNNLFNEEEARKIGRLESKLELEQQQRELEQLERANTIAQLELEQKRTQQFYITLISGISLISLTYVVYNQKQKNKLREKALEAELSELRIEIKTLIGKYEGSLDINLDELNQKLVNPLSEREYDVFKKIFSQKTNSEIADELFLSINTVKTHLKNLYSKLGVSNRKEALDVVMRS
ncbi:MAG: hypothetical protein Tsb0034_23180 [Ekhidna sp.]